MADISELERALRTCRGCGLDEAQMQPDRMGGLPLGEATGLCAYCVQRRPRPAPARRAARPRWRRRQALVFAVAAALTLCALPWWQAELAGFAALGICGVLAWLEVLDPR